MPRSVYLLPASGLLLEMQMVEMGLAVPLHSVSTARLAAFVATMDRARSCHSTFSRPEAPQKRRGPNEKKDHGMAMLLALLTTMMMMMSVALSASTLAQAVTQLVGLESAVGSIASRKDPDPGRRLGDQERSSSSCSQVGTNAEGNGH